MSVINPQECKAFHADVLSFTGEGEEIKSTVVTMHEAKVMIQRFEEEYPDVPLDEVLFVIESKDEEVATLAASLSYNTDEGAKTRKVVVHLTSPEAEEE